MTAPNVLFIITDQYWADHVGYMGSAVVRTPNRDAMISVSDDARGAPVR